MVISIRLTHSQEQSLQRLSRRLAASRSELIRAAIDAFCQDPSVTRAGHPYTSLARWIGCARSGKRDLSARAHHYVRRLLHAKSHPH